MTQTKGWFTDTLHGGQNTVDFWCKLLKCKTINKAKSLIWNILPLFICECKIYNKGQAKHLKKLVYNIYLDFYSLYYLIQYIVTRPMNHTPKGQHWQVKKVGELM